MIQYIYEAMLSSLEFNMSHPRLTETKQRGKKTVSHTHDGGCHGNTNTVASLAIFLTLLRNNG
jgi:hypothetical protein